jgi:hypothetical protein
MRIKMDGEPDDLIKKCKTCKFCIFEHILTPEQRKIKVLDLKNPEKHIHRIVVEQLCGRKYDKVCPMKYAAMKASCDDRTAMQIGVINHYMWDLGKECKKCIGYDQALRNWTKQQDLGRGKEESFAKRYEKIWDKGIRKYQEDGEDMEKQILSSDIIYEFIVAPPELYVSINKILNKMIEEHKKRDEK